jgi:hypothetical protein
MGTLATVDDKLCKNSLQPWQMSVLGRRTVTRPVPCRDSRTHHHAHTSPPGSHECPLSAGAALFGTAAESPTPNAPYATLAVPSPVSVLPSHFEPERQWRRADPRCPSISSPAARTSPPEVNPDDRHPMIIPGPETDVETDLETTPRGYMRCVGISAPIRKPRRPCGPARWWLLACDPAATGTRPVQTDRAGNQMRAPNRSAVVATVLDRDGASPLGWRTFWDARVHADCRQSDRTDAPGNKGLHLACNML